MPFDDEWKLYTEALWELQYVKYRSPLTPAISLTLHEVSYGIPDIANKVFMAAQWRAIDTKVETVTRDLLYSVYRDEFRLVNQILEVLKFGDLATLYNVQDVCPPPTMPVMDGSSGDNSDLDTQAGAVGKAREGSNDETKECLEAGTQPKIYSSGVVPSGRSGKAASPSFGKADLRGVIKQGLEANPVLDQYQSLSGAGYIRSASEFLSGDSPTEEILHGATV
jgi:hypothetical protein